MCWKTGLLGSGLAAVVLSSAKLGSRTSFTQGFSSTVVCMFGVKNTQSQLLRCKRGERPKAWQAGEFPGVGSQVAIVT